MREPASILTQKLDSISSCSMVIGISEPCIQNGIRASASIKSIQTYPSVSAIIKKWTTTMNEFMLEAEGPNGLFAVFHNDDGAGYLFVFKPESNEIISQICIYESNAHLTVSERNIRLMWSTDQSKCGISVFGVMRGIINIESKEVVCSPLPEREGIIDHKWLRGFTEPYFNSQDFITARQRYWQNIVNTKNN